MRITSALRAMALVAATMLASTAAASAAPGDVDMTWAGGTGASIVASGSSTGYSANDLARQGNGALITVGGTLPAAGPATPDMLVTRHTAAGVLDGSSPSMA